MTVSSLLQSVPKDNTNYLMLFLRSVRQSIKLCIKGRAAYTIVFLCVLSCVALFASVHSLANFAYNQEVAMYNLQSQFMNAHVMQDSRVDIISWLAYLSLTGFVTLILFSLLSVMRTNAQLVHRNTRLLEENRDLEQSDREMKDSLKILSHAVSLVTGSE